MPFTQNNRLGLYVTSVQCFLYLKYTLLQTDGFDHVNTTTWREANIEAMTSRTTHLLAATLK